MRYPGSHTTSIREINEIMFFYNVSTFYPVNRCKFEMVDVLVAKLVVPTSTTCVTSVDLELFGFFTTHDNDIVFGHALPGKPCHGNNNNTTTIV